MQQRGVIIIRTHRIHGRFVPKLVGLSLVTLVASLTIAPVTTNDTFIHLKTGELTVAALSPPHKDPYSFTAANHDYIAHEWLSAVVFYLVYAAFGLTGLILSKCVVILLSGWFLWLICWRRGDAPSPWSWPRSK